MVDRERNWVEDAGRARAWAEQEQDRLYLRQPSQRVTRRGKLLDSYMHPTTGPVSVGGGDPWVQGLEGLDDPDRWRKHPDFPGGVLYLAPHLRQVGKPWTSDGMLWQG